MYLWFQFNAEENTEVNDIKMKIFEYDFSLELYGI